MLLIQGAKSKSGKVVFQKQTETIDRSSGELTQTVEESVVRFNKEPPYIKMYIEDLCAIANAPNSLKDVLLLSLRKLDYDGYINLSTRYRKQMCIELGIKDGTLRNRLSQLVKRGFIESVGGNEYLANPNLFARGEWKDIVEQRMAFEMRIRYMPDGEKILSTAQVEINEQD